ncbi:SDR family NAD(P)-dependent oxidoreductase [Modestobacter versicolor]|uniref:Dehydrogenase n=1 Tax=Modestobacter versicolor TaxID=429133 RepID=A0A323VVL9_9ACTN|nr:SDR family oxidoreductase [Modestobacter versicolor]MBB3675836.1 NAD(P)-dependent dehydrogenase (short-subunit alcohol dehydrogenase family) [Modestobacter versicolor]PZA22848.1 dehydrogenase [Modestobacter versicolor]
MTTPAPSSRSVIVTGATGGMGGDFVRAFAATGADVVASDLHRSSAAGEELAAEVTAVGGGRVSFVPADITSDDDLAALVEHATATSGGVDVLVNNAGIFMDLGAKRPMTEVTNDVWDQVMTVNARGTWQAIKAVVPAMRARGGGRIVNMASSTVYNGVAGFVHYVASKAAVDGITRVAARELGPDGITVNALAPGLVETPAAIAMNPPEYLQRAAQGRFIQRGMVPGDLVSALLWLAAPESGFVTGQTIIIDGGQLQA